MTDAAAKEFWSTQTSSLHRSDDQNFYRLKAEEHAELMQDDERAVGSVDLGCGAGELLYHFTDHVKVSTGLDFSASMLAEARKRLDGKGVNLLNEDMFVHLPNSDYGVWVTTGAINQYLGPSDIKRFLDLFVETGSARSAFLFDCVDPVRYNLLSFGMSYRRTAPRREPGVRSMVKSSYSLSRRLLTAAQLGLGQFSKPSVKLGRAGMGYGYLPRFWMELAEARGLSITIVSSRFYEYRYHVILRKALG